MALTAFFIAALALAITPGPGIAYVVARTVAGGRSEGLASSFGTGLGGMVHVLAAALGVSALVAQSATVFSVLKYLGAAYLIYLGIQMLRRAPKADAAPTPTALGARRAFCDGVWVEIFNVKTALFFLAFLPQFVAPSAPLVPQLVLLGTICVFLNTAADVVAVMLASRLLESSSARAAKERWLTRASATTMIGLGAYLAFAKRAN